MTAILSALSLSLQERTVMKENTEKEQSDDAGKKNELRSGALRSSLKVELHTRYAILLWEGQYTEKTEKNGRKVAHRRIMGMPYFLHLVSRINDDSLKDDPFADKKMFLLEEEFNRGTAILDKLVRELDLVLSAVPPRVSLSEVISVSPVNISVFSRTPVGYRGVWLLVGFDQLALKAFQASHYGLISHARRDEYLRRGAQSIHRLYGLVQGYRSSGVGSFSAPGVMWWLNPAGSLSSENWPTGMRTGKAKPGFRPCTPDRHARCRVQNRSRCRQNHRCLTMMVRSSLR